MTNEELVEKIQQGERDLLPQLWEQVERYVYKRAKRWAAAVENVEIEDLVQSGYLALDAAVNSFDPEKETSFITFFTYSLKRQFMDTCASGSGWSIGTFQRAYEEKRKRFQHKRAGLPVPEKKMINMDISSLNVRLSEEPGSNEMGNFIADPNDLIGDAEERIFQQQLHDKLEEAMDTLEQEERRAIKLQYYQELDRKGVAEELGVSYERARSIEASAMRKLRSPLITAELESYIERRTPYFLHVGVEAFHSSGTSAVERIVMLREQMRERKGG